MIKNCASSWLFTKTDILCLNYDLLHNSDTVEITKFKK